ncbi:hypothetical protein RXV86_05720 [Alisedimentitalea sp. MJ-SS2]|uniref:hypothetical protein n=1 Tax=Aliisedimentitalea sp. MJ-SS2 TaxID=3049795 RepID=UPI00290807B0|nr:hypothetical protein [Alisedimentitalea sp. MJ-SS2]MDU8926874.1 hypothetical protein [Alisedimentitalea sp. MJ-SS2]
MKKSTFNLLLASTALTLWAGTSAADIVHLDDVIIDGSLCVGFDCASGEGFGFDTIRLKENNLRIRAQDTSSAAAFPTQDWQLIFNDSANGGTNRFSIEAIQPSSSTPFTIVAGARTNALYVDSQGDVGIGTSTPATDIHVVIGDTPTLRLEQNGSSGFTPQTFDVAANETNFFIRDATNGSTLPFRIRPGAPTSSLDIDADGNVGIGDSSPDATLDIERSDGTAQILVEETNATVTGRTLMHLRNNGPAFFRLDNTALGPAERWIFSHDSSGRLGINKNGSTNEFLMDGSGNITITGTLITTGGGGACDAADPCDAVFDPAVYTVPSIEDHAAEMWRNKHLPAVGPTGPGIPIDMSEKLLRMLNELEHAHIYIEDLHERLKGQEATNMALTARLEALEATLAD